MIDRSITQPESSETLAPPRAANIGLTHSRVELLLLLAITAGGVAARFIHLGSLPLGAAGTEEGTSWLVTAGQMQHGYPLLPSGIAYWKGLPYTLLAALTSSVFGLSGWSLRVPSAATGALAVPLAWWTTRAVLRRLGVTGWPTVMGGLLAAYLLAFSQWSVLMSRWGRFYTMGQTLFLAGFAIAAIGFSAPLRPARWSAAAFGAVVAVAAATFHPGGLLLIALPAAVALGVRFDRRQRLVLTAFIAATALWFAAVLFLWKSGHVIASHGWQDLVIMVGLPFWKHMLLLLTLGFGGWALIARAADRAGRASARKSALIALGLLVLLELIIFLAAGVGTVDTGALRGFHVLAQGHPGVMALAFIGTLALLIAARRLPAEGIRAAGMLWILTVIPIGLVGASTGNFVPRYLLFTFGPVAVLAAVGAAFAAAFVAARVPWRGVGLAASVAAAAVALWAVAPAVSPLAFQEMISHEMGAAWPALLACSPTRAYAQDLESPARFVVSRMLPGDLVVSTARSIPEAIIGRMDYFFRVPSASNTLFDESGGPFNILTGCPMLSRPEQVFSLCADRRVFVILDERALHLKEVRALKDGIVQRVGPAAFGAGTYAEVYVLPPGCGTPPAGSSAAAG